MNRFASLDLGCKSIKIRCISHWQYEDSLECLRLQALRGLSSLSFEQLDVFGFDLDCCGEVAGCEVDNQPLVLAASFAHQTTDVTIQVATYDADLLAIESRGDLIVTVVLHLAGLFDGLLEPNEFFMRNGHRLKLPATTKIAVLQQGHVADDWVELCTGLVYEDEVGQIGNHTHHALAELCEYLLLEGHKQTIGHAGYFLQLLVGGIFCVRTCQIAQHIPTVFHEFRNVDLNLEEPDFLNLGALPNYKMAIPASLICKEARRLRQFLLVLPTSLLH